MNGVPALAGKVLPFEGGSKHSEIKGETASDRLKPGLHTLSSSFASEICGLEHRRSGPPAVTNHASRITTANPHLINRPASATVWA
jgi:hypothetical protein